MEHSKNKIKDKYIACLVLEALGDTIGFHNGIWEFNYGHSMATLGMGMTHEILYDFIDRGGINEINLEGWYYSDDTLLTIAVVKSLLDKYKNITDLLDILKKNYIDAVVKMENDFVTKKIDRSPGVTTLNSVSLLQKGKDYQSLPYDTRSGGSGAAMRTAGIGLAFYGEKNREQLIEIAVESSRLTHNSAYGYLGGLTTALFTAFAIEGIHIYEWPYMLIDILNSKSDMILKGRKNEDELDDYRDFVKYWKKFLNERFKDRKPIKEKAQKNLIWRVQYHHKSFVFDSKYLMKWAVIGESGYGAVIMAYDSLVFAENNWEKLVIYSMLHLGDSDTVGAIASAWFGAMYGFADVPEKNLKYLEDKDMIIKLASELYDKYNK